MKGHSKRVDFISIDVEAWYTKKPSLERGAGHRTKRDIHTYIHTERLNDMQLYIVRLCSLGILGILCIFGSLYILCILGV